MRITKPGRRPPDTLTPARDTQTHRAGVLRRVTGAIGIAPASAARLIARVPGALRATRAGAHGAMTALQTLPDPTLRWIAATSVGLGAGLRLAGAPRLVSAAGAAPALIASAAIALRPIKPVVPAHEQADASAGGIADMTDEHTKGAISKIQGKVEEGLGTLTGNKRQQAKGKGRQVKGDAQKALGDVQDAIRGPKDEA